MSFEFTIVLFGGYTKVSSKNLTEAERAWAIEFTLPFIAKTLPIWYAP